ncbi:hypothetical protein M5J15_08060 [Serratia symbiotica]|uniref:hypothetical protein n=1 Tax=Serratia symbiotica TaxID=138074 RepID=UPI002091C011|nr:hypothetical protein [Serratia symbiotica]USS96879.1 hypothetical protein M5J15_08060 [Serratia symbiotica]
MCTERREQGFNLGRWKVSQVKGIFCSMSRGGNGLDNALTERFFRSLKSERVKWRR